MLVQLLWKSLSAPKELKTVSPPTSRCTPTGIRSRGLKANVHYNIIHNREKVDATQVSVNRWLNKMWSILTVKYCSAVKRNEELIPLQRGWALKALR